MVCVKGKSRNLDEILVLLGRIELPTSSLPMTRSTTELQQHSKSARLCEETALMSSTLRVGTCFGSKAFMKKPAAQTKEERLAQALRANLRRRKTPVKSDPESSPGPNSPK
jgi:hypothetical protein